MAVPTPEQRRANYAAYSALSQEDKIKRLQTPVPTPPLPNGGGNGTPSNQGANRVIGSYGTTPAVPTPPDNKSNKPNIPTYGSGTSNPILKNSEGARVSANSLGTDFKMRSIPSPPMPTEEQKRVQNYINSQAQYGGLDNYKTIQQDRYQQALASNDTELLKRLRADAQRVGYDLKERPYVRDYQSNEIIEPIPMPEMDFEALARAEFADQLAAKESWAKQQIAGLNQAWDRSNQLTNDQRVLENWQFEDKNSPFAGRTSYLKTNLGRERTLADAASRDQYNAAVGGINQQLTDFRGTVEQQIAARTAQLQQQAIEQAMREAELTGEYNGTQTLEAKSLTFDQDLATKKYDQSESQRIWENTFAEKQFTEESARNLWERTFKEKTFDQEVKAAAKRLNLDWAQLSQRQKEFVAEEAYKAKSLALDERKLELDSSKPADYSKDMSSIESMYVAKDPYTGQMKITNAAAMKNAIIALNMPDEMTDRYLIMYGLPINQ